MGSQGRCTYRGLKKSSGGGVKYIPEDHQTEGFQKSIVVSLLPSGQCHSVSVETRKLTSSMITRNSSQTFSCPILLCSYHLSDQPLLLPFQVYVSILWKGIRDLAQKIESRARAVLFPIHFSRATSSPASCLLPPALGLSWHYTLPDLWVSDFIKLS